VVAVVRRGADTTAQAPVRLVLLLLTVMLAASASLGLDVILGTFVAGAIIRMLLPPDHEWFLARLDGIGYGFLIPVFFVVSGMGIDAQVLLHRLGTVLIVFALILLLRGGPVLVLFRHLDPRHRWQLGLFCATGPADHRRGDDRGGGGGPDDPGGTVDRGRGRDADGARAPGASAAARPPRPDLAGR
jgi:Kef-type K+ transport system membrane component KefB